MNSLATFGNSVMTQDRLTTLMIWHVFKAISAANVFISLESSLKANSYCREVKTMMETKYVERKNNN